jgi:hypothetical protein
MRNRVIAALSGAGLSGETELIAVSCFLQQPLRVMPGLVPGIHAYSPLQTSNVCCNVAA